MKLKIVTPTRTVLDDEVEAVYARTSDGEFGVLPHHQPLVAPLEICILHYTQKGQDHRVAVMGGIFSTDGETTMVLSDNAELATEVDAVRAHHAKERAEARLREKEASVDVKRAELSLARALVRLKLGGK